MSIQVDLMAVGWWFLSSAHFHIYGLKLALYHGDLVQKICPWRALQKANTFKYTFPTFGSAVVYTAVHTALKLTYMIV